MLEKSNCLKVTTVILTTGTKNYGKMSQTVTSKVTYEPAGLTLGRQRAETGTLSGEASLCRYHHNSSNEAEPDLINEFITETRGIKYRSRDSLRSWYLFYCFIAQGRRREKDVEKI